MLHDQIIRTLLGVYLIMMDSLLELINNHAGRVVQRRHLFTKISYYMQKQSIMDDKEVMYILRQLGIGAIIGGAFLTALYLGELVAHLCSGM